MRSNADENLISRMQFDSIQIFQFRNYKDIHLKIPSGVVVFHGENAQGKTNLIEALYFLVRGESFRPVEAGAFIYGADKGDSASSGTFIRAKLNKDGTIFDLAVQLHGAKKRILLNGKSTSSAKTSSLFPTILFSPESLASIKSGPEERRVLLDELLGTEGGSSIKILQDFRKLLRSRNRILKDHREGKVTKVQSLRLLESLDGLYLPLATELVTRRIGWLKALRPEMNRAFQSILRQENVDISVEYVISKENALLWSREEIISAMHNRSLFLRESELESGRSLVGPHKHDINFLLGDKNARFFGSQGQQRALILAFKMAQIMVHYQRYKVYPLLFLDDVLSELDPEKRTNLIRFLREIPSQIFLTTTDLSFSAEFGQRELTMFKIEQGQILND